MNDYKERKYLSSIETAKYLGITQRNLHSLVKESRIKNIHSATGQKRFRLKDLKDYEKNQPQSIKSRFKTKDKQKLRINNSSHMVYIKDAKNMYDLKDNSVHLMITSPPYFNAKMYTKKPIPGDLGNIHDLDQWFEQIKQVWKEVFRVLQPGRKAFINIMNLPIRKGTGGFKSLNLTGRTIDIMEQVGFIFKRDIVWHKTNGVKAHFGTYPYPGGILINNMHEFILEFNKPDQKGFKKYGHLTQKQKEMSKLDKEFWLSIKNTDVWKMKPEGSGDNRSHVAPFPYQLPYRFIKAFTYVSETVLDPFLGSGTTTKVAADLKRNSIGYEIVPEIVAETINSLKNYQNRLFV